MINISCEQPPYLLQSLLMLLKCVQIPVLLARLLVFKNMEIMTLYSQYIYLLILYTVNNKYIVSTNNEIHKYSTRYNNNLHLPTANLSKFNKGAYISGVKVFNHLPQYIKTLANDQKCFKSTLKRFLCHYSFYSMDE